MDTRARLSRRNFTKLTLLGTAGLSLGSGCSLAFARVQDRASRWQSGDGLRLAGPVVGPASLDPALSRDLSTNFLIRQIFRGLMELDATLSPAFALAESVDISADGLTYTFTLRESTRFHDGRAIRPEDVWFSFSRALDPDIAGGSPAGLAGVTYLHDIAGADDVLSGASQSLSGVAVGGARSIEITLARRSPTFLMKLASAPASIVDEQQVRADPNWLVAPNGSGPFAISAWEPGVSIDLAASETWWAGTPRVRSISIRLGTSASQPINLYQAGEIDLVEDVPAEIVELVVDPASGVNYGELIETQPYATSFIAFGNAAPPLDDIHVRKAVQRVFPWHLVAESTFNGAVETAEGLLPPGMLGEQWATRLAPVDVSAAREELRLSRYGAAEHVPPIAIYAADIASVESLREVAAEALGITIEAIQVPWQDFLDGLAERRFAAYSLYWGADYPDPESMIEMLFESSSPDNYTGYRNPELDALLDLARDGKNGDRIDMFKQANQLLIDDAALIPLYHPIGHTLVREGLGGAAVTPMGIIGLESFHEIS